MLIRNYNLQQYLRRWVLRNGFIAPAVHLSWWWHRS